MLKIREARSLLKIDTRDTINSYLRLFKWDDVDQIDWIQFRRLLELQVFLGLKPGRHSKEMFLNFSQDELNAMFTAGGISIDRKLSFIHQHRQQQYQPSKSRFSQTKITVQLVLDRE